MNIAIKKPNMSPEKTVMPKQEAVQRIRNYEEIVLGYTEEMAKEEAERCMNCPGRYCAANCPIHNPIPEFNAKIREGDFESAWELISENSPLPEVCSRVCDREKQCESNCTRGIRHEPVAIGALERFITDWHRKQGAGAVNKPAGNGKNVAIVGAGPSGIAAAWDLIRKGYHVTVYEKQEQPGGLLMYGIPNMKLDKGVIRKRVDMMEKSGVKFLCNSEVGENVKLEELIRNNDAVLLAIGSTDPVRLNVPGNDAKGVVLAVDYLKASTRKVFEKGYKLDPYMNAKDKNVIVIGAGDTGTDCVGTAMRQGARSVHQFEITSKPEQKGKTEKKPWTDWPKVFRIDYGHEEAICAFSNDPRIFNISTTEVIKNKTGEVEGLNAVNVEWKYLDGKYTPVQVAGSESFWKTDLVVIAMGFAGPGGKIMKELGLETDSRGNIPASEDNYKTKRDKIYVCGDARRGQSMVIWGIVEGKQAAASIDKYLHD